MDDQCSSEENNVEEEDTSSMNFDFSTVNYHNSSSNPLTDKNSNKILVLYI
jgi:hypothetical protein